MTFCDILSMLFRESCLAALLSYSCSGCGVINKTFVFSHIDIDECASVPCLRGGACTDQVDGYTCVCRAGYAGNNCELGRYTTDIHRRS